MKGHGNGIPRPLTLTLALLGCMTFAATASATTRYAAPGGTAADTVCVTPDAPKCSIGAAAGGPDVVAADEAVILPGNYSDTAGDLNGDTGNPTDGVVQPTAGSVHGASVEPMPVITVNGLDSMFANGFGAFLLSATTLSHVRIDAGGSATGALTLGFGSSSSVVEHVIATSVRDNAITCNHWNGILRDSVCSSSGSGGVGVGASVAGGVGTMNLTLRNVTAISTGANSFGASYRFFGGSSANWIVNSRSVIAKGTSKDVVAGALMFSGSCPNTTVSLDFSDYATTQTANDAGCVAAVSPAGSSNNQVADPMLAADGVHQLAGSITVDHGFTDGSSGSTDIDGQARTIGSAPDIGADELAFPTTTAVSCTANPLVLGAGAAQCGVTVTDITSTPPVTFLSGVRLTSDQPGSFVANCETLFMATPTQGTCTAPYTPTVVGSHTITAVYPGDANHDSSQDTDVLDVTQPIVPTGPGLGPSPPPAAKKKCKKKKHKRSAAAAKKKNCKKKKK
jgi:hypothetical protein